MRQGPLRRASLLGALVTPPLLLLALSDPERGGPYPRCPFRLATGLDCPGCGTLRGLHDLTHGNLVGAVDHNLLMVLFLPLVITSALRWVGGRPQPRVLLMRWTGWVVLASVVGWAVLRNLPVDSLAFLGSA